MLWPVFHNRLDLAQFEAGYFEQLPSASTAGSRAYLQPMLRPDDIIWVHDYHLIPLAAELRKLGVNQSRSASSCTSRFRPGRPSWPSPSTSSWRADLAAYDLVGLQTKADVANLIAICDERRCSDASSAAWAASGVFDRLVSIASFPVGIDVADFANGETR